MNTEKLTQHQAFILIKEYLIRCGKETKAHLDTYTIHEISTLLWKYMANPGELFDALVER